MTLKKAAVGALLLVLMGVVLTGCAKPKEEETGPPPGATAANESAINPKGTSGDSPALAPKTAKGRK